MRPEIYGFDLAAVQAIFGSGNKVAFEKINTSYQEKMSEYFCDEPDVLAEYAQKGEQIIQQSIIGGVPFGDLDCEQEVHVYAANEIVQFTDPKLAGDTTDWHMEVFLDLRADCAGELTPDIVSLLSIFEEGRPFLGKKLDTAWAYYGYLNNDEVQKLFVEMEKLSDSKSSDYLDGFLLDFTDWLDGISSQNMDLWFIVS
jgi:hypothetical protein